jgi:allophanate hydrolase
MSAPGCGWSSAVFGTDLYRVLWCASVHTLVRMPRRMAHRRGCVWAIRSHDRRYCGMALIPCPIPHRQPKPNPRRAKDRRISFFDTDVIAAFLTRRCPHGCLIRMGVRWQEPPLHPSARLDVPSEAIVRGSVQVASKRGGGFAGGSSDDRWLSKVATVLDYDLDQFVAQRDQIMFQAVTRNRSGCSPMRERAKLETWRPLSDARPLNRSQP